MDRSPEGLEAYSAGQQKQEEKQEYTQRPIGHRIGAWILIAVVLFAFLGTCYWLANYGG